MTKRKSELSLLNILMCLAVITVHVISWTITNMDTSSIQYVFMLMPWRLLQFVVQGFIFLSAVKLFSSAKQITYEDFLFGRYKKIVLPYVIWVLIYYAYFILTYGYTFSFNDLGGYLVFGTICSHFYFVVIIMQFYLHLPLFKWLCSKVNTIILCIASVVFTAFVKQYVHFQYDDRVFFTYLCYFVLGAAVGKNYDKVIAFLKKRFIFTIPLFLIFASLDGFFTYRAQAHGASFKYIEIVHLFYCLAAIFFVFALCIKIAEGRTLPAPLRLLDRSSYLIYLCHVIFIYMANALAPRIGIASMMGQFVFRFVFAFALTLIFSMGYTFITEKIKNGKQAARTV
ncbi:MAG: acyltransferase [Clostridia bacterium]|nr:acyltransferase [Clostridia bacterium]